MCQDTITAILMTLPMLMSIRKKFTFWQELFWENYQRSRYDVFYSNLSIAICASFSFITDMHFFFLYILLIFYRYIPRLCHRMLLNKVHHICNQALWLANKWLCPFSLNTISSLQSSTSLYITLKYIHNILQSHSLYSFNLVSLSVTVRAIQHPFSELRYTLQF